MAKRVYTKKGDIYEIRIDKTSKRYMQFIGSDWNQLNSDTFRVYKKIYPIEAVPSLEEIFSDTPDFYVHSYASGGIKDGLWSLAYRCKDVGDTSGIKFATYDDLELPEANIYRGWRLWYFSEPVTETSWFHRGDDKPSDWENADKGGVMPTSWLYNKIKYGKFTDRVE